MSLISDTDYLIHSMRLSYLRNVEDPYGARLITLDPSYTSNPYISAASLADVERWPELAMPSSPQVSDNEGERPSGFPGATGLKHTQTIMGGRSGGMGLRVNAKRVSSSKRVSATPRQNDVQNFISEAAPVQDAFNSTAPVAGSLADRATGSWVEVEDATDADPPNLLVQEATAPSEPAPVVKTAQFIPKFKGAAEMEARRRVRMLARRDPAIAVQPPAAIINPELSSSDEDDGVPMDSDSESDGADSDFDHIAPNDSMDDGDDFDPDFAATRTPGVNSDSASDMVSVLSGSNSIISTSNSSIPTLSSHTHNVLRPRHRLSPVSEVRNDRSNIPTHQRSGDKSDLFEMVTPVIKPEHHRNRSRALPNSPAIPASNLSSEIIFSRHKVSPIHPLKSALSAMLASAGGSSNPFAEMYASISGRGETSSTNAQVYFPHAKQPAGKSMDLNVRKDATVEEVIGFALWTYWEEGWLPKLDDSLGGDEDPKRATRLSAVGWIMRIAEEDGEVDDEFPPPDRTGKITKFNFDAYAILEASPAQIQQNQILESKVQRRPSRTMTANKSDKLNVLSVPQPFSSGLGTSAMFGSTLGSLPLSTSLGPSSSHGPQIFLRIRVEDTADAVHISTTIPVSAGMYMQEALELVCRKRKLMNPNDYALLTKDMSILIPLDRTVASLQGQRDLLLVKRSMLNERGGAIVKGPGRTTDPNASIFKRMSDTPVLQHPSAAVDYTAAYKKYTIFRKMPMLVTRQERTLAIDGVYIHIMPSTNKAKAVFDSGKTSSYHIKSIADCHQSTKSLSIFKLVITRAGGNKWYDFEAESPKLASEIVQMIRGLKAALDRSGAVNRARRSRHVI